MSLPTFAELLTTYMRRIGVTDAELARKIGVQRQTIFRWKEGTVGRPRVREDVLRCAECLRLTPEERDGFLLAAGFAPEGALVLPPVAALATPPMIDAPPVPALMPTADETPLIIHQPNPLPSVEKKVPASEPIRMETPTTVLPAATGLGRNWRSAWWAGLLIVLIGGSLLLGRPWERLNELMGDVTRVAITVQVPTPSPMPPPTPLALRAEDGIVVSQFKTVLTNERYDVAARIQEAIATEMAQAGLISKTVLIWPEDILTSATANVVLAASDAALVIWGEYDSGRVLVKFATRGGDGDERTIDVSTPNELSSTIKVAVPNEARTLALLTLGKLYLSARLYAEEQEAFEAALALQPTGNDTRATIYFYLARIAEREQTTAGYARAINYYTQVIALKPEWVNALYNRGTAYLDRSYLLEAGASAITETLDAAILDLGATIAQSPHLVKPYLNRGIAYYERRAAGDLALALQDFEQVVAVEPAGFRGVYHRGLAHLRAGDSAWVADFQQALKAAPHDFRPLDALCWGYALDQAPETALPYCDQAIGMEEKSAATRNSRVSRGIVYAQLARNAEAIADFELHLAWLKTFSATRYNRQNGPKVAAWMAALQRGEQPFDAPMLNSLR